jgi:hypothetical protein
VFESLGAWELPGWAGTCVCMSLNNRDDSVSLHCTAGKLCTAVVDWENTLT